MGRLFFYADLLTRLAANRQRLGGNVGFVEGVGRGLTCLGGETGCCEGRLGGLLLC